MIGIVNIGKNASDVKKSVLLQPYSKVVIVVDENTEYVAGNDTGLTLEIQCPWGTQQMANDVFAKVQGYQYQPYSVTGAIVDPAAEMGDAVQANGVYGGMYQQDATFGRTFYSDFSAPEDEQLDHEYTYQSSTERAFVRERAWSKSQIKILNNTIELEVSNREADSAEFRGALQVQSQQISAKVSQTGGNNSSFGWSLLSNEFGLYAGSKKVFSCNSSGVIIDGSGTFSGKITATTGAIGGWDIASTSLSKTVMSGSSVSSHVGMSSSGTYAFYAGTKSDPASCEFRVTKQGKIYATSGEFTGKVVTQTGSSINGSYLNDGTVSSGKIGSGAVTSGKISDGAVTNGKIGSGAVTSGKIGSGAVSRSKTDSNVQASLDNGDTAYASFRSLTSGSIYAGTISATGVTTQAFRYNDHGRLGSYKHVHVYRTIDGNGDTIDYLGV